MNQEKDDLKAVERALRGNHELLESFNVFLKKYSHFDLEMFFGEVDQTDYSLADWVEALLEFEAWMTQEGAETRPFREMLGYIHCCTQMSPPTISLGSLKVLVSKALTDFGFDAKGASHL